MRPVIFLIIVGVIKVSSAYECGKSNSGQAFSVGGEYSVPGQWPWLASIFYKNQLHCGSSIISKKHLLSAAHCIQPKGQKFINPVDDYYALLGHHELKNESNKNAVKRNFSKIIVHPDWSANNLMEKITYDADIAILIMKTQLSFTDFIQPICLPKANTKVIGIEGTVVGYGKSENFSTHENRPKHVKIKSVENAECYHKNARYTYLSSLKMFCAGERGKNPCNGDSGGPFMVESNDQWTIYGIVSASLSDQCLVNDFVLFTQVRVYLDWIKSKTKDECGKPTVTYNTSGNQSYVSQWPWLALVRASYGAIYCTSSIISRNFLLSVASCVKMKLQKHWQPPPTLYAYFGQNIESKEESTGTRIAEIFMHPDWVPYENTNYDADIVLLQLQSHLAFNDFVKPICLPKADVEIFNIKGVVANYDYDKNFFQYVETNSIDHEECQLSDSVVLKYTSLRMFCAATKGKISCNYYHRGSPFMIQENDHWTISGMASINREMNCHNQFSLYTQVSVHIDWIKNIIFQNHELECDYIWHENFELICYCTSLKVLQPNLRLTSVMSDLPESSLSNIEKVIIQDAQVHYLPDFTFITKKFPNLKELRIWRSGLTEFNKDKLRVLSQLTVLNLYENQIKELSDYLDFYFLKIFAFSKNQVKVLPTHLLWNLPNLEKFWAWSNQIEVIPPQFFDKNENIQEVLMHDNKLKRIIIDFKLILNLKYFNLKRNKCVDVIFDESKDIEGTLNNTSELDELLYEKCTLISDRVPTLTCEYHPNGKSCNSFYFNILKPNLTLEFVIGELPANATYNDIEEIDIYNTNVHYLPDFSIANRKFPNFNRLSICKTGLKELERTKLAIMPQLLELKVNENDLEELPDDVFHDLVNLKLLDFSNNFIKVKCLAEILFETLKDLEILNFSNNHVQALPQKILWNLHNLKELDASYNMIEVIPVSFFQNNMNIETIHLGNNKITRIGEGFDLKAFPRLNILDLSSNECINEGPYIFKDDNIENTQIEIKELCIKDRPSVSLLKCQFEWNYEAHTKDEFRCGTLKILEPNIQVTSIIANFDGTNHSHSDIISIEINEQQVHYLPDFSYVREKFPNFNQLTIENSELKELDKDKLSVLSQLTHLSIDNNEIENLPQNIFDELVHLEFLSLGSNQVKLLEERLLWKLSKLKEFYAENNEIEVIPANFFKYNTIIEEVWLHQNKISKIFIDLKTLASLSFFDLRENTCINEYYDAKQMEQQEFVDNEMEGDKTIEILLKEKRSTSKDSDEYEGDEEEEEENTTEISALNESEDLNEIVPTTEINEFQGKINENCTAVESY